MNLKAQSAIEFMTIVSAIVVFFLMFLLLLTNQSADQVREQRNNELREVALTVRDEITLAHQSSDGYQRSFRLPSQVLNVAYNITLVSNLVYVRTLDGKEALAIPVANVTGSIQQGTNTLRKTQGVVYLNP